MFASFRARLLLLAVAVVVLHLASFSVLLGFLAQQAGLLTDMAAAGSVADAAQRLATLSVVLDAAERGYGFNRSDMPAYAAEFDSWIARCARVGGALTRLHCITAGVSHGPSMHMHMHS